MEPKPLPVIGVDEEIPKGSIIAGFDYILPVKDTVCQSQIDYSIGLGFPDAAPTQNLVIVANGPSAKTVDLKSIKSPTLALNGSLKLFLDQGITPTYWAACDPQELVADFLPDNPPENIIYLVASKCHPKVFEKLKDRSVYLWHLRDHPTQGHSRVPIAPSVTICVSWLMYRLGFTDFEYWGWDACFLDNSHHASGGSDTLHDKALSINFGGKIEGEEVVGGKTFLTSRTWVAESQGAEQFFHIAEYFDIGIKINGEGMIACILDTIRKEANAIQHG